ncbi:MAG TPA: DNA-processing protein DprA [Candidatus Hydrogenedens sp.]|nr:DNA-processing protein DprA [Candidatus Hydrogenedens sp.]
MIYSSFSSKKNTSLITSACLSILKKTKQSWKTVHLLLSLDEEKILDIFNNRKDIKPFDFKSISISDIVFQKISIISQKDIEEAEQLLMKVQKEGWNIAFFNSEYYPKQWLYLRGQLPPLIFFKGMLDCDNNNPGVAIVGTTQPTKKCIEKVEELVKFIIRAGAYPISGGAMGVDRTGHDTSIHIGGSTQVIIPCGVFHYPIPYHWERAIKCNKMQVISPWLPSAKWESQQAVRRNLFIASLAKVGCLFQPAHKGGSFRVAQEILSRHLPVFVYEPLYHAKILKHLPQVLPLVNDEGKLNYTLLEQALKKVKDIQEEPDKNLFN